MNKQEVLNKIEERNSSIADDSFPFMGFSSGERAAFNICRDLVEQLDEPETAVVPKEFDEWYRKIKRNNHNLDAAKRYAIWKICQWGFGYALEDAYGNKVDKHTGFWNWMCDNKFLAIDAILNGYEIEKEKFWVIPLPEMTRNGFQAYLYKENGKFDTADNCNYGDMKFTEIELEKVPSHYRKFAVPAENE